jgi:hypothetical protein
MKQTISKATLVLLTGSALVLASCDSSKSGDVSEAAMSAAIDQHLAKNGGLCLSMPTWPVQVSDYQTRTASTSPHGIASQMAALALLGLVSESQDEIKSSIGGRNVSVRHFHLTEEGKKFWRPDAVRNAALAGPKPKVKGDLCYGDKAVAKVVRLDPLPEYEPVKAFNVRYLYKVVGLAEWAKRPEFQVAFPGAASILGDAEKEQQTLGVKVTDKGLETAGARDY